MLEAFYKIHDYQVAHVNAPVRRVLNDEIDWKHRLIGIKGCRGVGKTTFLLMHAKELERGFKERALKPDNYRPTAIEAKLALSAQDRQYRSSQRSDQ